MPRCYYTGLAMPFDKAFVLNRREAHRLRDQLAERLVRLQRLLELLGPMDPSPNTPLHSNKAPVRHRLVCKAIAEALAQGFPEVTLFEAWMAYHARVLADCKRKGSKASAKPIERAS